MTPFTESRGSAILRRTVVVDANSSGSEWKENLWDDFGAISDVISRNFATVVVLSCTIAALYPRPFLWIRSDMVSLALAVSMLAMGCTLKVQDFAVLGRYPFRILIGVLLQYTVMPSLGFCISRFIRLPSAVAAGLVLVACCPGGVASNLVTYLAGGDVALSVAMTSISTLLAIGLTPILTAALIGTIVPVDGWGLFRSTIQAASPRLLDRDRTLGDLVASGDGRVIEETLSRNCQQHGEGRSIDRCRGRDVH